MACECVAPPPALLVRSAPSAGTLPTSASNQQVLDSLPVERERGITVKAQVGAMGGGVGRAQPAAAWTQVL